MATGTRARQASGIERPPIERLAAWLYTGPLGHLYGALSDIGVLWVRWGLARVRARVRSAR